jgi:hypothetical protein
VAPLGSGAIQAVCTPNNNRTCHRSPFRCAKFARGSGHTVPKGYFKGGLEFVFFISIS